MTEGNQTTGRSADHPGDHGKPEVNRVAELVRPVGHLSGREAGHTVEPLSFAERLGIIQPSPHLADHAAIQTAEEEKTFVEKEMERREKAGTSGSGGNWTERARILPVEQKEEKEIERER